MPIIGRGGRLVMAMQVLPTSFYTYSLLKISALFVSYASSVMLPDLYSLSINCNKSLKSITSALRSIPCSVLSEVNFFSARLTRQPSIPRKRTPTNKAQHLRHNLKNQVYKQNATDYFSIFRIWILYHNSHKKSTVYEQIPYFLYIE